MLHSTLQDMSPEPHFGMLINTRTQTVENNTSFRYNVAIIQ